MTMLHAQGGPAEEEQEEGRPARPSVAVTC